MVKRKQTEEGQESTPESTSQEVGESSAEVLDVATQNLDDFPAEGEIPPREEYQPSSVDLMQVDPALSPDEYNAPGQEVEATLKKYNEANEAE
jgi:hypothetical protein